MALVVLLAACGGGGVTAEEERWCEEVFCECQIDNCGCSWENCMAQCRDNFAGCGPALLQQVEQCYEAMPDACYGFGTPDPCLPIDC